MGVEMIFVSLGIRVPLRCKFHITKVKPRS